MYRRILVPLDRSPLAEQALPLALAIARQAHARLDLAEVHALYALDEPHSGWAPFDPAQDAECRREEDLYLQATARWLTSMAPIPVTTAVLPGSSVLTETVADGILERANATSADLIVMATHGSPVSRLCTGSVGEELIRRATVPVLLVPGREKAAGIMPGPPLRNILILLDGSALSERVLGPALELARVMEARCSLLRVVEHSEQAQAEEYLAGVAVRARGKGPQVRTRAVVGPHVVEALLKEGAAQGCDLIALATHGRGGLRRMLLGSVADRLVRLTTTPILVYRPTGEAV